MSCEFVVDSRCCCFSSRRLLSPECCCWSWNFFFGLWPFLSYKIGLDFLTFCFPDEILTKKHALPHRSVNSEALNKECAKRNVARIEYYNRVPSLLP